MNNLSLKKLISSFTFAVAAISTCSSQNGVSIKIELDSAYLLMGKQTAMHIEILQPSTGLDGYIYLPGDTITKNVEIAAISEPDTVKAPTNDQLMQIRQDIILQSFDSGLYVLPPISYVLSNGDTIYSNSTTLKVVPVDVDSLSTIHSFAPVVSGESRWWDFLPDFVVEFWLYGLIILIIILGGIAAWLLLKKKVAVPFMPKTKPISPYEEAISSLAKLKEEKLCENGLEKEYYTRLTDILRQYLDGRFGINAMEMTSSQILRSLENNSEISSHKELMRRILEIADFVKFAKVRPLPDDNVASWTNAQKFVEDTKPAPESETTREEEK